tara:strand:- start:48 stop:395 length:348 start_codon:yes stop_codon:yes gene_type:complete
MALTYTSGILADHKGMTTPKVSGDEYYVDCWLDITEGVAGGAAFDSTLFGLSTVNAVVITGQEDLLLNIFTEVTAEDGTYASGSSFELRATTASSGADKGTGAWGTIRLRIYGLL